jgi:hypothetical protein
VDAVLAPKNFQGESLKLTGTLTPGQEVHRLAIPAWRVENGERSALRADWTVTVTNAGPVPVLGVEIGCDDESEGRRFDWQPEENALVLLPGESRAIPVRALAHAGRELPQDLIPTLSAWNVAVIRPLHDPMNHPATENMRTER